MDATQRSPQQPEAPVRASAPHPAHPAGAARRRHAAPAAPAQLRLLSPAPWRLNDTTREIGRRGVASAREALRSARRAATIDRPGSAAA